MYDTAPEWRDYHSYLAPLRTSVVPGDQQQRWAKTPIPLSVGFCTSAILHASCWEVIHQLFLMDTESWAGGG